MPRARKDQIPPNTSCYVHCISRCVRRSWLCGFDPLTRKDNEHRRAWIEDRLLMLAEVFAVSVYAYAVMSNHLHVVLKLDADAADQWTNEEVAIRWCRLFPRNGDANMLEQRIRTLANAPDLVSKKRDRLRNLGCFMGSLNEFIARKANAEDECPGRFWQGRYKSQILLDERALLAAMTYADLNPIRAKMTTQLKSSKHTGIRRRITMLKGSPDLIRQSLKPIAGLPQQGMSIQARDYLAVVNYTGRQWHRGNKGKVPSTVSPLLKKMKLDAKKWSMQVRGAGAPRSITLGSVDAMVERAIKLGRQWLVGIGLARMLARTSREPASLCG